MPKILRIATRKSALALWQAEYVADRLRAAHRGLEVAVVPMSTRGDEILDQPLARIGGKGLFTKELERAMLDGRADIAAHSMKDVPVELPEGMALTTVLPREDPRDAFVSVKHDSLLALPHGARVGSSSLRRQCQIKFLRPDLDVQTLRGNVQTRLGKLDAGDYDAIILAAAGLKRLRLEDRIAALLDPEDCLPAIGQGTVGIECMSADSETIALVAAINDADTWTRTLAERALNHGLHGSCQVPVAGFAVLDGDRLHLRGRVGEPDGSELIRGEIEGPATDAEKLGASLAEELLRKGADKILARLGPDAPA